jgi:ATP-binding cassette subfamily F protein 3
MGKMEQESQRFSRLLLGKTNRQQETYLQEAVVAYLPQHLLATDGATVREASKAFGEIFGMKADIDEINEQLTIRTDYESDAYMKLIERVSDLSEKFYAIEEVNYEAEVENINRSRFRS